MDELTPHLEHALSEVSTSWDPARTETALRGLKRKRVRRVATRVGSSAGLVAVALVLTIKLWPSPESDPVAPVLARVGATVDAAVLGSDANGLVLDDGTVVAAARDADIEIAESTDSRIEIVVKRGRAQFTVPANSRHRLVRVGAAEIAVDSAVFTVASYADTIDLEVASGQVEVLWEGQLATLGEGESRRLVVEPEPQRRSRPTPRPAPPRRDWRVLARDGELDQAYAMLRGGRVGDDVADLLLAADVCRMSGHPARALTHLERVVKRHPDDARAPLAAFTLGRVLLDDLGRPAAAARAFSRARGFAPAGALSEDALAREVEAWSKAGKASKARARAQDYLDRYPRGHRLRAVKQYGHL